MKKNVLALLLDVTPLTKATLSRAFKPVDFEVLWTASVTEAEEALTRQRVDLLLLDFNQPLRTRWGDFERLIHLGGGAPAVILTEHKSTGEDAAAEHVGAVLRKPFSANDLMRTVHKLLGLPSPAVAPPARRDADHSQAATGAEDVYRMNSERHTAPLVLSAGHRYWGINE